MTSLPESTLELIGAVAEERIALQVYDELEKKFRFGILEHSDNTKTIRWLPLIANDNNTSAGLEHMRIAQMSWSPDGNILAVSLGYSTYLWDNKEKHWLKRTENNHHNYGKGRVLWLDNDRILSFNEGDELTPGNYIYASKISNYNAYPHIIGELKGISIKALFQ